VEMENAEKRGLLINANALEPKLKSVAIAAREYWRNEPVRLAREIPGKPIKEIESLLSASFDTLLLKLSHWPLSAQTAAVAEDGDSE